jgi:hypothetical protein
MASMAGWGWRERIRHRHFLHHWTLRLNDWTLECPVCQATRPDPDPRHAITPRADELDYVKENYVLAVAQRVLKALAAAVSAGIASYGVAVADGTVAGDEWVTLVVAAIGAGLVVWAIPNKEPA